MSSLEKRSKTAVRLDGLQRQVMWHYLSGLSRYVRVSEYPKSGGTWLSQIISSYLEIPFPRNQRPSLVALQPCLLHGHHLYAENIQQIVCILRDGRDVMVSAYFHMLHHHRASHEGEAILKSLPSTDYRDVKRNMPAFIEYMFTNPSLGGRRFRRGKVTWAKFTESWLNQGANIVTYELMQRDAVSALVPVIERLTGVPINRSKLSECVEKFSFKNQTNRTPGVEDANSFLRKGVAGDWKEKFTAEACDVFKHFAGKTLINAGYERDMNWTSNDYKPAASPMQVREQMPALVG